MVSLPHGAHCDSYIKLSGRVGVRRIAFRMMGFVVITNCIDVILYKTNQLV